MGYRLTDLINTSNKNVQSCPQEMDVSIEPPARRRRNQVERHPPQFLQHGRAMQNGIRRRVNQFFTHDLVQF